MSAILVSAYLFFIPFFFAIVAAAVAKPQWTYVPFCLLLLACYAGAVLMGLSAAFGARHASGNVLQELGIMVFGALGARWLIGLMLLFMVIKSPDRSQ
ncbi:hypothetical protein [Noviherbaspirillum sp.]|uniref:hypothetical protein n=1 Tax=Noviherbaspirillum sp. TaxID=1926288 RepID=UPI002FE3ED53